MSQRGGSVVTYVRYGDSVSSPIIEKGEADIILSFEQLEAARQLPYLKKGGKMIINTQTIDPMPVITGAAVYPEGIIDAIKSAGVDVTAVDALSLSLQAGSPKAVNVVLIGVMARFMSFDESVGLDAVKSTVPSKFLEMNVKAFGIGYSSK